MEFANGSKQTGSAWFVLMGLAASGTSLLAASCEPACREYDGCGTYQPAPAGASGTGGQDPLSSGGSAGVSMASGGSPTGGNAGAAHGGSGGGEAGAEAGAGSANGGQGGEDSACDSGAAGSCATNANEIFVSPAGDDDNAGTKDAPLATLRAAVARAVAHRKGTVVACTGTYYENLEITTDAALQLSGGRDCTTWEKTGGRSTVQPASGVPLRITRVKRLLEIEGFEFQASDAIDPGASSVAAVVVNADNVRFIRVRLAAGHGADGLDATAQAYVLPDPSQLNGKDATETQGGMNTQISCPGGTETRGGRGADAELGGYVSEAEAGLPETPGSGQAGESDLQCSMGGGGRDGADGESGADGAGAASLGKLGEDGTWIPMAGADGQDGKPGQGGGGGRGGINGGGGGGGSGGCGGKGGTGGGGGGASIGLIAVASTVSLILSEIETKSGGDGGDGAAGQLGQLGGASGNGHGYGCAGGTGGVGGNGGSGGGGAGGLSVAILTLNANVDRDDRTKLKLGTPGDGGNPNDGPRAGAPGGQYDELALEPERD